MSSMATEADVKDSGLSRLSGTLKKEGKGSSLVFYGKEGGRWFPWGCAE